MGPIRNDRQVKFQKNQKCFYFKNLNKIIHAIYKIPIFKQIY